MRTFASGSAVVISRHASMPFLPGISTSIRMTSVRSLSAKTKASSPSPVCPTTVKSSESSNASSRPFRTISLSSTSTTLIVALADTLHTSRTWIVGDYGGCSRADSANAWRHLQATAHAHRVGAHVAETMAPSLALLGYPDAIVRHGQTQLVGLEIEADFDSAGLCMEQYVGHRVVDDPEELATDGRRQVPFVAILHYLHGQGRNGCERIGVGAQRLRQTHALKDAPRVDGMPSSHRAVRDRV